MVWTLGFHCLGLCSIPGWGTEILQALQHNQKKKRKRGGEREEKEEYKLLTMTKYRTKCCMRVCVLSWIRLFATPWTVASQGPRPWNFPGKNTGMGCHFLLHKCSIV